MSNVLKQHITFKIGKDTIVGDLYLPQLRSSKVPAVVVAGPMTSVKEQVTGVYARAMAELGFAALAIDHRYYGESSGQPRQYEFSKHKVEDIVKAVDFLAQREMVDENNLGLVGICLGCGYASWATIASQKVKWLGLVVGYYRDVEAMKVADFQSYQEKVNQGVKARELYERSQKVLYISAVSLTGDAAMTSPNLIDYYDNRAKVSNYTNSFAVMSREHFLPFDVQSAAKKLTVPVVMVHSENALSPHLATKFYDNVATQKETLWLNGKSQDDFYDNNLLVAQATAFIVQARIAEVAASNA